MTTPTPSGAERLAAVAALSRAGASPGEAWQAWGGEAHWDGASGRLVCPGASQRLVADAERAARLAETSGVPLADILDALARIEVQREEAMIAREVAAAGPRASARTLMWLPLGGLALGIIVDPGVLSLFRTGLGWILLGIGGALAWAGRRWLTLLVASARQAGEA